MRRRPAMILLAALVAAPLAACSRDHAAPAPPPAAAAAPEVPEPRPLTIDEVATRIAAHDGHTFIYDDNNKSSWVKGHVPGAAYLQEDAVTAADLPADKTATLIFYCHNET